MKNQSTLNVLIVLTILVCTLMSGLATLQIMWAYAQGNFSPVLNQTGNQAGNQTGSQTGNQSLSSAIPGQQGGTPPKTGPS